MVSFLPQKGRSRSEQQPCVLFLVTLPWISPFSPVFCVLARAKCLMEEVSSGRGSHRQELSFSRGLAACFLSPPVQQECDRRASVFCLNSPSLSLIIPLYPQCRCLITLAPGLEIQRKPLFPSNLDAERLIPLELGTPRRAEPTGHCL